MNHLICNIIHAHIRVFQAGWSPVRNLLKGANQVASSDKYTRRFRKSGDYDTAVRDFNAAHPTSVSKFTMSNGVSMI